MPLSAFFDREGYTDPRRESIGIIRSSGCGVFDDLYRPHTFEEVEAVVSPGGRGTFGSSSTHYGLWWFNRLKTKTRQASEASKNGRVYRRETRTLC